MTGLRGTLLDYIASRSSLHLRFAVANRMETVPDLLNLLPISVVRRYFAVPPSGIKFESLKTFQSFRIPLPDLPKLPSVDF